MKTFKFDVLMSISIDEPYDSEDNARHTVSEILGAFKQLLVEESEILKENYGISFGDIQSVDN